jgi:hypothetical protein
MKATLYRLPARNLLVIEEGDKPARLEYPATEVRAHQIAQDAGVSNLTFGRIEDVISTAKRAKSK